METIQTRQVIEEFYARRARNDFNGIRDLLADDAVWSLPPSRPLASVVEGAEAIAAAMTGGKEKAALGIDLESVEMEIGQLVVEGARAAVLQPLRLKTLDGEPYENVYAWFFYCQNDRIVRLIEFTDTLHQARRFGWK